MPSETASWDGSGTFGSAQHDALAAAVVESAELAAQNFVEIGGARRRRRAEDASWIRDWMRPNNAVLKSSMLSTDARGRTHDCLHRGKGILDAVVQLADQKRLLLLRALAIRDVHQHVDGTEN